MSTLGWLQDKNLEQVCKRRFSVFPFLSHFGRILFQSFQNKADVSSFYKCYQKMQNFLLIFNLLVKKRDGK
jgi:cephalosporin-C deacetylase-like acetyl esterase